MAASIEQRNFLARGGVYAGILEQKYQSGEMTRPEELGFKEYPKFIRLHKGTKTVTRTATAIRGKNEVDVEWTEEVPIYEDHTVNNEDEEESVLAGGKSASELEEERQQMISELRSRGMQVDPSWSLVRLQRERGAMPPREAFEALQNKIETLEREAALKARIAELESQLGHKPIGPVDEAEVLRGRLAGHGVEVDRRWSLVTLRQKLEAFE